MTPTIQHDNSVTSTIRGKFIVIEGGEGSGKSTCIASLKRELPTERFLFAREPGGNTASELIRAVLTVPLDEPLDTLTELLLFKAARREHVTKLIEPALAKGIHIVCDRFSSSTFAHQIVAQGKAQYRDIFERLGEQVKAGTNPDHYIFLDINPTIGIERKKNSGSRLNVFDERSISYHMRVRDGFRKYFQDKQHTVIDASRDMQHVYSEALECIRAITGCNAQHVG